MSEMVLNMGKRIIFCNCGGDRISQERLQDIENNLIDYNAELIKLSDLCGLAALDRERLATIFRGAEEYMIIGCHSRSLKLLLGQANVEVNNHSFHYANFLESSDEDLFGKVTEFLINNDQTSTFKEDKTDSSWPSWYPVIDYTRCSACGQCADFCLFGVYEKSEGRVNVIKPAECKNNCPACARICPQAAIIFPKYKQGGAIGGSDSIDEVSEQKRQAIDINNLPDGDIYSALEQRKHKRKSIITEEAMKKALEERSGDMNKQYR